MNSNSDTSENTVESNKNTVRVFLQTHDEVVSKKVLRAGTDVPAWYITQISSTDTFYRHCLVEYLLDWRSIIYGLIRPVMIVVMPEAT